MSFLQEAIAKKKAKDKRESEKDSDKPLTKGHKQKIIMNPKINSVMDKENGQC